MLGILQINKKLMFEIVLHFGSLAEENNVKKILQNVYRVPYIIAKFS